MIIIIKIVIEFLEEGRKEQKKEKWENEAKKLKCSKKSALRAKKEQSKEENNINRVVYALFVASERVYACKECEWLKWLFCIMANLELHIFIKL